MHAFVMLSMPRCILCFDACRSRIAHHLAAARHLPQLHLVYKSTEQTCCL